MICRKSTVHIDEAVVMVQAETDALVSGLEAPSDGSIVIGGATVVSFTADIMLWDDRSLIQLEDRVKGLDQIESAQVIGDYDGDNFSVWVYLSVKGPE